MHTAFFYKYTMHMILRYMSYYRTLILILPSDNLPYTCSFKDKIKLLINDTQQIPLVHVKYMFNIKFMTPFPLHLLSRDLGSEFHNLTPGARF